MWKTILPLGGCFVVAMGLAMAAEPYPPYPSTGAPAKPPLVAPYYAEELPPEMRPLPLPAPQPAEGVAEDVGPCPPCRPLGRRCATEYPWCPMPLGACLRANVNTQIANGLAAGMVLYRCDFCDPCSAGANRLNAHGHSRLSRMAGLMQGCAMRPLLIESTGRADLDAARRDYVQRMLGSIGIAGPMDLVIVGRPEFPMLSGEEAVLIHNSMVQEAGRPAAAGGNESTGFSVSAAMGSAGAAPASR